MVSDSPLGKPSAYPDQYSPALLHPIARSDARAPLGLGVVLPFSGVDIWNAWELTWLAPNGKPMVACAEIRVPATSPNIVESKSLKLYLNSFAMSRYASRDEVAELIRDDLQNCIESDVSVSLETPRSADGPETLSFRGTCIDSLEGSCDAYEVDANLLASDSGNVIDEALYSHLLRSLCPVTGQPDIASVLIDYGGPRIDPTGLLRYIVSFRKHNDFHEACIERMFVDIQKRCLPQRLSVYARYQRRGGIDINPFRSTVDEQPENLRLWRQ